jgi:hypothetical protein
LTNKRIRRASFFSVNELIAAIEEFLLAVERKTTALCVDRHFGAAPLPPESVPHFTGIRILHRVPQNGWVS